MLGDARRKAAQEQRRGRRWDAKRYEYARLIRLYYTFKPMTRAELAAAIGCQPSRVRDIERRALAKIRASLQGVA